ncbi:MAG: glycine zipper family protein [Pseudomonadota bacterium]
MIRHLIALGIVLGLSGCAGLDDTQQRALTGSAAGAAGGAVIGAIAGSAGLGAAIGAGTGLLGGLVVDRVQKDKQAAYDQGFREGQAAR